MKRKRLLALTVLACFIVLPLLAQEPAEGSAATSQKTLAVKLTYKGQGEVDARHRIHVFLFDTPDISAGVMPIGWDSVGANGATLKFPYLSASPVYLVAAFDKFGDYDPATVQGPPPQGTPIAVYAAAGEPAGPAPVKLEAEQTEIEFAFDDSFTLP